MSFLSGLALVRVYLLVRLHPRVRDPHSTPDLALLLFLLFPAVPLCLGLFDNLTPHPWIAKENLLQLDSELFVLQQVDRQFISRFTFCELGTLSESPPLRCLGRKGLGEWL